MPIREIAALAAIAVVALLYLMPLPVSLIEMLPGRSDYVDVWRAALGQDDFPRRAAVTLVPSATWSAWVAMLIPIGVFIGVRGLPSRSAQSLVHVILAITAAQSVIGLIQFGAGAESPMYFGMEWTHFDSAVGTYTNRNHLAGLIEMSLPLAVALMLYSVGRGDERGRGVRSRLIFLGSVRGQKAFVYGLLLVLFLVAVAFTRSRTGIALTMLGIVLSLAVFARRIGGDDAVGPVGTAVVVAIGLAVTIGLVPVFDRFSAEGMLENTRWSLFQSTLTGISRFFPIGSGPGTFQDVFPAFQPEGLGRWFVNRAHNDYLELVFETGLLGAVLVLWLIVLYAGQWKRVWSSTTWSSFRFLQVGAGIGIFLVMLHEFVDYNLHIPANQVVFAVIAGLFFRDVAAENDPVKKSSPRHTPRLGDASDTVYAPVRPAQPAPDQIPNPFLDDK